jgi:precorrin-2 dehydrogenase/sirohydrochlorin ferrochelatase
VPAYYPVFLDLRDRRVVVVGGGALGEEKVERLLEYGAKPVVISPDLTPALSHMAQAGEFTWIERGYEAGDLEGAFIAIVADTSDPAVNDAAYAEGKERNVPLNVNDVTHQCTWIAPSVVRRGEVIVATSTGGASPALARKFREELAGTSRTGSRHPVMDYADLTPILSYARTEILRKGIKITPDHWQACMEDDLVDMVREGRNEEAKMTLMARLMLGAGCDCAEGTCKMWEDLAVPSDGAHATSAAT